MISLFLKWESLSLSIECSFRKVAEAAFVKVVIIEDLFLYLTNQILTWLHSRGLSIETVNQTYVNMQGKRMLFWLYFLDKISAEDVSWFEGIELELWFSHLVVFDVLPIDVYSGGKLSIQKDGIDYVEYVFPKLKVRHNGHLLHIHF